MANAAIVLKEEDLATAQIAATTNAVVTVAIMQVEEAREMDPAKVSHKARARVAAIAMRIMTTESLVAAKREVVNTATVENLAIPVLPRNVANLIAKGKVAVFVAKTKKTEALAEDKNVEAHKAKAAVTAAKDKNHMPANLLINHIKK